jgi:hypothetical protein
MYVHKIHKSTLWQKQSKKKLAIKTSKIRIVPVVKLSIYIDIWRKE